MAADNSRDPWVIWSGTENCAYGQIKAVGAEGLHAVFLCEDCRREARNRGITIIRKSEALHRIKISAWRLGAVNRPNGKPMPKSSAMADALKKAGL